MFINRLCSLQGRLDNRTLGPLTAYQSALTYMAITDGHSEGHMLGSFVWWAVRSLVLLELCSHEDKLSCAEPQAARAPSGRAIHSVA